MIELLNVDCQNYMLTVPDKYFDLAIVDPPYGINFSDYERVGSGIKTQKRHTKNGKKEWDKEIPSDDYFKELFRVSKNQIIWGGNYFPQIWDKGCRGFIFWYKQNPVENFSDGELAWTSFDNVARCLDYRYYGNLQGKTSSEKKIHPTQKPVYLYEWLLLKYAIAGNKILDTHLGSASSAIAAHNRNFDFVGCEIDKNHYDAGSKRFKESTCQVKLF